jgi:hypothetical protein
MFISCSDGLRSHAAKALCESLSAGESASAALARIATTKSAAILQSPHLVQWLTGAITG